MPRYHPDKDLQTTTLLKHIFKGIRKHGTGNYIRLLQAAESSSHNKYMTEFTNSIIAEIAKVKKTTVAAIFKRFHKSDSRHLCYVLMKQYIGMNEYEISCFFNTDNSVVYKAIRKFNTLNLNIKVDREMKDCYDGLCLKIDAIKKSLENKYNI